MNDQEYVYLRKHILRMTGIDLNDYKSQQLRRRLDSLVAGSTHSNVVEYCRMLERDPTHIQQFKDYLGINVTEFMRDAWAWQELSERIIPLLTARRSHFRAWSCGCSNGAEAYTLAIILEQQLPYCAYSILGTDIDASCLVIAQNGGPYSDAETRNLPPAWKARYFTCFNGRLMLKEEIKQRVRFKIHNMLSDPFEYGYDLIVCRNVTIYFTEEAKERLFRHFHDALNDGGILFIGATEFLTSPDKLGYEKLGTCFYRRASTQQTVLPRKARTDLHLASRN